jgi:hypothetical protein
MEGVLAAFAQFDNDVRSDRTRAGMKAALELGGWVFLAPIGYLNPPRSTGKSLIHDPERAPLVRRAFEEHATGRYTKEQLLKRVRTWGLTNRRGKPLTSQAIGVLLRQPVVRRNRGRARVRRSRQARRLRSADLGGAVLPRPGDSLGPCAEHGTTQARILTSRCAASFAANPADAAPAVRRRVGITDLFKVPLREGAT